MIPANITLMSKRAEKVKAVADKLAGAATKFRQMKQASDDLGESYPVGHKNKLMLKIVQFQGELNIAKGDLDEVIDATEKIKEG